MVNEIKKALTDQVIAVREKLLVDLTIIDFLLKTSAARQPRVRSLLKGNKKILRGFKGILWEGVKIKGKCI